MVEFDLEFKKMKIGIYTDLLKMYNTLKSAGFNKVNVDILIETVEKIIKDTIGDIECPIKNIGEFVEVNK